jgi:hypothetical protein
VPKEKLMSTEKKSRILDPSVDFERYRDAACRRFIAAASRTGFHLHFDLDELAQDFYGDFWLGQIERPRREPLEPVTPYIVAAMMNKLSDLSRRGRSVRATQMAWADNDMVLARIAAKGLGPAEQMIENEEVWRALEVVGELPERQQVSWIAVWGRHSKKKGSPPAGYRLAAAKLKVRPVRAKKLVLDANRRIRAAADQIESGTWCERWAQAIELAAANQDAGAAVRRHAEHCVGCRLAVAGLRRRAKSAER